MSEPQQTSKKNKKKKKTNTQAPEKSLDLNKNNASKLETVIDSVLPLKVGMTTKIKDVEVTMTNNGNGIGENGTAKKKKKKKKSKQLSNAESEEPLPSEIESKNLLNFNENHIELINHPEISVTISNTNTPQVNEPPKCPGSVNSTINNGPSEVVESSTNSKKKKKKKKKKTTESNSNVDAPAPEEIVEDAHSTPTYVKLPADGDNCVLLVSHESFSNGSKQTKNSPISEDQNKTPVVVLNETETKDPANNSTTVLPALQNGNNVSIFPIFANKGVTESKVPQFDGTSSLDKIKDVIEKEKVSNNDNTLETALNGEETKTKAQLKAERRAKQEAQRAAKLAKSIENSTAQKKDVENPIAQEKNLVNAKQVSKKQNQVPNESLASSKKVVKKSADREVCRKVQIFSHLPQYQDLLSKHLTDNNSKIPPPILELGDHYSKGTLCGSNARCVGFLSAVREVILNYVTPPDKTLSKDLECKLQTCLEYLNNCRPLSVSVVNAMKYLKHQIRHIPEGISDENAKENLSQSINDFVREEILLAKEAITISASAKIVNDDTILVFAYSSLVKDVLCKAHDQSKTFKVIIVDSRAKLEGLEMLRQLVNYGLHCSYISINAVSSVIKKVNKVIIGAHALLANGYVMSRLGCKILSLVSSSYKVPVLVCCETYKFWERALTDSIVHNELGDPDDLILSILERKNSLLKWRDLSSLQIYNLLYDVTPSDFVSVVITEKGLIPCTAVPVLLRVKHAGKGLPE